MAQGDSINGYELEEREPDASRLMDAYFHSCSTLNYLRALTQGGFADLVSLTLPSTFSSNPNPSLHMIAAKDVKANTSPHSNHSLP